MNTLQKSFIQKYLNKNTRSAQIIFVALLFVLLFIATILSIVIGASNISLKNIVGVLFQKDASSQFYQIIYYVRIPRTFAALLSGAALSVSGLILQSVLNNSLASPNILGVNAGSGLGFVIITALFPSFFRFSIFASFLGALGAVLLVYLIAIKTGTSKISLILSGIAVSSLLTAVTDTFLTLYPETAGIRQSFLIGGFSGVTMEQIKFAAIFITAGILLSLLLSYEMNVLALGEDTAKSLGLRFTFYRLVLLFIAALLAGASISYSGLIGFVGLIVPHCARLFVGYDNRILLPVSAILGSLLTLICDLLARVLFAPYEIPVGIVLSFLGAPFFLYLLIKKKGNL